MTREINLQCFKTRRTCNIKISSGISTGQGEQKKAEGLNGIVIGMLSALNDFEVNKITEIISEI